MLRDYKWGPCKDQNPIIRHLCNKALGPAHQDAKHGYHKQEQDYHKDIYRQVHICPSFCRCPPGRPLSWRRTGASTQNRSRSMLWVTCPRIIPTCINIRNSPSHYSQGQFAERLSQRQRHFRSALTNSIIRAYELSQAPLLHRCYTCYSVPIICSSKPGRRIDVLDVYLKRLNSPEVSFHRQRTCLPYWRRPLSGSRNEAFLCKIAVRGMNVWLSDYLSPEQLL
jgi:hypothetical protein